MRQKQWDTWTDIERLNQVVTSGSARTLLGGAGRFRPIHLGSREEDHEFLKCGAVSGLTFRLSVDRR